jgi:hypothetical protein
MHHSEKEPESKTPRHRPALDAATLARMQECDALARLLLYRANRLLDTLPRFLINPSAPCKRQLLEAALLIDVARLLDTISSIRLGALPVLLADCTRSFRRLPSSRTIQEALESAGDGVRPVFYAGPDGSIRGSVESVGGGQ